MWENFLCFISILSRWQWNKLTSKNKFYPYQFFRFFHSYFYSRITYFMKNNQICTYFWRSFYNPIILQSLPSKKTPLDNAPSNYHKTPKRDEQLQKTFYETHEDSKVQTPPRRTGTLIVEVPLTVNPWSGGKSRISRTKRNYSWYWHLDARKAFAR